VQVCEGSRKEVEVAACVSNGACDAGWDAVSFSSWDLPARPHAVFGLRHFEGVSSSRIGAKTATIPCAQPVPPISVSGNFTLFGV
jgi:hypothetical protein